MKGYEIKITVKNISPPIWRKIVLPANITFETLHHIFQTALGWENRHLHEFSFKGLGLCITSDAQAVKEYESSQNEKKNKMQNTNQPDISEKSRIVLASAATPIEPCLEKEPKFTYTYDFGDAWQHTVELIQVLENIPHPFAQVTAFRGKQLPEDCGGPDGYTLLYKWLETASPEQRQQMQAWQPIPYDLNEVNEQLRSLTK